MLKVYNGGITLKRTVKILFSFSFPQTCHFFQSAVSHSKLFPLKCNWGGGSKEIVQERALLDTAFQRKQESLITQPCVSSLSLSWMTQNGTYIPLLFITLQ